jgi:DNA-binding SARP family transcriptional activator
MLVQEASGAMAEALTTSLRLLETDPLQEQAVRTAMRAFCHLGQRNAALELYHHAEKTLDEELEVPPENETRLLYQAILEG